VPELWTPPDARGTGVAAIDPYTHITRGVAVHGDTPFACPLLTQLDDRLAIGGCLHGAPLPEHVRHVVSLYPWETYRAHSYVASALSVVMYDAVVHVGAARVIALARWVNACRADASTLVHCQTGLNRSGLVVAVALVLDGYEPAAAIDYLRAARCSAVLCNRSFESFVLEHAAAARGEDAQATRERVAS